MMMNAYLGGLKSGFAEAADVMARGVTNRDASKFFQSSLMETLDWNKIDNKALRAILKSPFMFSYNPKFLKFVGRSLAGADAMIQTASRESIVSALAYAKAKEQGKTRPTKELLFEANKLLHNTKAEYTAAKDQAKSEGYKGLALRRRIAEIIHLSRDSEMAKDAESRAAKITYNYDPEGLFSRSAYNAVIAMQRELPATRFFVPFARIVTNITQNYVKYSPYGIISATVNRTKDSGGVRKMIYEERSERFIKGIIGTSVLFALIAATGDDEESLFEITANGTGELAKNYELQAGGWRPYTITLKNGVSISYKETPLFPVLAAVGALRDAERFKKDEPELKVHEEISAAAAGFVSSIFDQSWLQGLDDMLNTTKIADDEGKEAIAIPAKISRKASDLAGAFIQSNFSRQLLKGIDDFNGRPIAKPDNDFERIFKDVPYLRDLMIDKEITNVLGDPVVNETWNGAVPLRFTLKMTEGDPLLKDLNEKGIFIGRARRDKMIFNWDTGEERPMTSDEYYKYFNLAAKKLKSYLIDNKDEIMKMDRIELIEVMQEYKSAANEEAYAELFIGE
jgi:hypothetical protein